MKEEFNCEECGRVFDDDCELDNCDACGKLLCEDCMYDHECEYID